MLFLPRGSNILLSGSFRQEPYGLVLRSEGAVFLRHEVAFVIPEDEEQQEQATKAKYAVHTPLSMNLGAGATSPGVLS